MSTTPEGYTNSGSTTSDSITTNTPHSQFIYTVIPYGLDVGWKFDLIHATGLTSLSLSFIACVVTLAVIIKADSKKNVFTRQIGERLVIYLAVCNLLYCISHIMDHSYMFAVRGNPPDAACAAFAFFLNEFVVAQSLIVIFTAVNAFVMVVKERKIPLGKYDWGLFAYAFGIPFVVSVLGTSTGHFGPSGMWCYMDHRTRLGPVLTNIVGVVMIVTFIFNVTCYTAVWIKIKQTSKNANGDSSSKYTKTARTMMLFVAVYIAQWWCYCTYAVWNLVTEPQIVIMVGSVFFSNMGGVYNLVTYVLMKRQKRAISQGNPTTQTTLQQKSKNTSSVSQ